MFVLSLVCVMFYATTIMDIFLADHIDYNLRYGFWMSWDVLVFYTMLSGTRALHKQLDEWQSLCDKK